jgi:hypoxanthine phosphoribosyltransferase
MMSATTSGNNSNSSINDKKSIVTFPSSINPNEIEEVLFTNDELANRVAEMGLEISNMYNDLKDNNNKNTKPLIVICTLKGAVPFFADLVRTITYDHEWEFMSFSSYGTNVTTSTGAVRMVLDLKVDIAQRDVLIIEDILDTGHTLRYMLNMLAARSPNSIRTAVLLHKPERTISNLALIPDFVGFTIPNKFVVGYGLDYNQKYRSLSWIGVLAPWVYSSSTDSTTTKDEE